MTRRFLLPCECGRKLVVSVTQAGEQLHCECGATPVAPNMRGLQALPPAPDSSGVPAPARSVGRPLGSDAFFAVSLFVLVVTLVALVPLVLVWLQLDTSFTIDTDIGYGNEQIQMMPIDQTWDVWEELQVSGLQVREVPFYTRVLQYRNVFSRVIMGLAIVAGLSVIGLAYSGWRSVHTRSVMKARVAR